MNALEALHMAIPMGDIESGFGLARSLAVSYGIMSVVYDGKTRKLPFLSSLNHPRPKGICDPTFSKLV